MTLSEDGDAGAKACPFLDGVPRWDSFTAIGGTESVRLLHFSYTSKAKQNRYGKVGGKVWMIVQAGV